jgi:thiol-disulfide isomerase/thioredoxin
VSYATKNILGMILLAACAAGGYFSYSRIADRTEPPRALQATAVFELPDFTLPDLEGTPRAIRSWADSGQGLLINFWATWCAPCLREIPLLTGFQTDQAGRARVIGIAVDRLDDVVKFAPAMNFNYPILVGEGDAMEAAAAFGVDFLALPFTVFTAPDGEVLAVHTGEIKAGDLDNYSAVLTDMAAGTLTAAAARQRLAGRE